MSAATKKPGAAIFPFTRRPRPARPVRPTSSLSANAIQARLDSRLAKLDGEQLQIVEIVVAAITRGVK